MAVTGWIAQALGAMLGGDTGGLFQIGRWMLFGELKQEAQEATAKVVIY